MHAWRVAAASAIGTSHVASGAKCQDALDFGVFDASGEQTLILVVADGAGSARHSDAGAQCAVFTVRREIETYFDRSGTFHKLTREVAASWLDKVQHALLCRGNCHRVGIRRSLARSAVAMAVVRCRHFHPRFPAEPDLADIKSFRFARFSTTHSQA